MTGEDYEAAKDEQRRDWPGHHLPECEPDLQLSDGSFIACICAALRACEARVRVGWEMSNGPAFDFARGYAAGVQAARDAVAALPHALNCWDRYGDHVPKADALAAIDALRGES